MQLCLQETACHTQRWKLVCQPMNCHLLQNYTALRSMQLFEVLTALDILHYAPKLHTSNMVKRKAQCGPYPIATKSVFM